MLKVVTLLHQRICSTDFAQTFRFACAHHFSWTVRKKYQMWKRSHKTSRNWESGITKSPTCQLILKLRLASPSPRITLQSWSKTALRVNIISRGRAFKWFAASAERKCIFEGAKLMNPEVFGCFSRFSHFLNFWLVLKRFHYEFRFPGVISCPEVVPDHSGIEFSGPAKISTRT